MKSSWNFEHFDKKDDARRFCNFEITHSEKLVRKISKKLRLRETFNKQHGKWAKELLKSASQHLYQIHSSLPSQLSWKTFLLLTWQILALLVNTLAADERYPVLNSDNLTISIEIQLSQKKKTFSQFFARFLKSSINLNISKKRLPFINFVFPKLRSPKRWSDKCLKSPRFIPAFDKQMVNVPKHC